MIVCKTENGKCVIDFTEDDLLTINNSLNEICYGLEIRNFENRTGISKQEVFNALETIHRTLKLIKEKKMDSENYEI